MGAGQALTINVAVLLAIIVIIRWRRPVQPRTRADQTFGITVILGEVAVRPGPRDASPSLRWAACGWTRTAARRSIRRPRRPSTVAKVLRGPCSNRRDSHRRSVGPPGDTMPKQQSTAAQRARETQKTTGGKYTALLRDAQDSPTPQANESMSAAMLAGLEARSLAAKRDLSKVRQTLREELPDRMERGGAKYVAYLQTGYEAAIEALEYAVEHGVDAVDEGLADVAARKGHPIGPAVLEEALRRVRDHTLLLDGSTVAETAYWVADRYWMHRWNNALDQAPIGKWDECVGPQVYRRMAVHEWMSPGVSDY